MFAIARRVLPAILFFCCASASAQTSVTLQQGLNGYTGTADARIWSQNPNTNYGATAGLTVNHEAQNSSSLVRFAIFQSEGGPVPDGATITSATLSLYKYMGGQAVIKASRLLKNWGHSQATWNSAASGTSWTSPGANSAGSDYLATADGQGSIGTADGCIDWPNFPESCWLHIDVTTGVQAFASGTPNYGWKIAYVSGDNDFSNKDFTASEHSTHNVARPKLTIAYTVDSCDSGSLRPFEQAPINGSPISIAASGSTTFEAEHFNCGGEGVAYHDNMPGNAGNAAFRTNESVDISTSAQGNVVNNFETGEWLTYTIDVAQAGTYDLAIWASNNQALAGFHIKIDDVDVTGNIPVDVTGSWETFDWFTKPGVALSAGQHVLKLFVNQQYFNVNQLRLIFVTQSCDATPLRPYGGAPINGNPIQIAVGTTLFEAEHFNCGGEGVAYHDNMPGNAGNATFRTDESVDISTSSQGNVVNNFETGEWLAYTIDVAQAGTYDLAIWASNNQALAGFHIKIDDVDVTGNIPVDVTGSWETFDWFTKPGVALSAGQHVLKLFVNQEFFNVNQLRLTFAASCDEPPLRPYNDVPLNGSPISIAATGSKTFEAEHFNCGGEGVAYHDNMPGNAGNAAFRTDESVDVSTSSQGNVVNNFETGEWLTYTIDVAQAGTYDLAIWASNNQALAGFHIRIDDVDVTGNIPVNVTGSWETFNWFTKPGVTLSAGQHLLKLFVNQQYFNVNQICIVPSGGECESNQDPDLFHSFETSTTENGFYAIQAKDGGAGGRVTLVSIARDGSSAVKLTTFAGDGNTHGSWGERADLSSGSQPEDIEEVGGVAGMTWWWAHSIYLPVDFHMPQPGQGTYVLMDWHDNCGPKGQPVPAQANYHIEVRVVEGETVMVIRAFGGDPANPTPEQEVPIDYSPQREVWYDFVHYVEWASDNTAVYRTWMKKGNEPTYRLVFERIGQPNLYEGCDVYLKLANYHGVYGVDTSVIHDRIVRGTTSADVAMAPLENE